MGCINLFGFLSWHCFVIFVFNYLVSCRVLVFNLFLVKIYDVPSAFGFSGLKFISGSLLILLH